MHTKVRRILTGAVMKWTVEDPLRPNAQIVDTKIEHRNPYYRLMKYEIVRDIQASIERFPFKWRVKIECEFKGPFGKPYYRGADLVISGILNLADSHYQQAIEDVFAESNMSQYVTTHVTAEIIGVGHIKEEDFAA